MKTNRQTALLCALLAALLFAGCKDLFHPEGPEEQPSAPSTPYNVTAEAASSSSIAISWSSVYDASQYKVYRATSSSGNYLFIDTSYSASYTDTGLSPNTTYYYKVSAGNSYGESDMSSYGSATTTTGETAPSAPLSVTAAAQSSSSITVSWGSVPGASGYYVYRSASSNGTYSRITTASATPHTDTGLSSNTTYYYKVSAFNSQGEGVQSSAVSATTTATAPSFGTSLTSGQTTEGNISTTPQHYYFSATQGRTYTVFWYDYDSNSAYGDVRVSAFWNSSGSSIFTATNSGGSSGMSFTAGRTDYVMLEVTPYLSRPGRYQILYR
jgi:hypothetical protein